MKRNTKIGLARNIKKVATLRTTPIQFLTRAVYLDYARERNLNVIRSKGTIQSLGGYSRARKAATKL